MDHATGEMQWYFQFPNRDAFFYVLDLRWEFPVDLRTTSGLLSTAGDLVFGGTADGFFFALDAETGEELWHRNIGGRVHAGPMAFAVDGRQHVAIAAGNAIFAFALPE